MNEEQIAAEQAAKLPPEQFAPNGYPDATSPEGEQSFTEKLLPEERLTQSQLLDYFGVPASERYSPEVDRWINDIYGWARENAGSGDLNNLLRIINEQEHFMGSKMKPGRLSRMAQYIQIAKVRTELAEKERLLYG